nr:uncharacterized protein LOC109150754 [Ipomoea batatas]
MDLNGVASAMATLTLAGLDDDDNTRQIGNVPVCATADGSEFYAVGRLVTDKPVKLAFLRDTMASVWRPAFGMNVRELQPRRFLFRFFDDKDISRIIEDGPWTYEQNLLILQRTNLDVDPDLVELDHAEFWIQVHGLPAGLRSEAVLNAVRGFIGRVRGHGVHAVTEKQYGPELRAGGRRNAPMRGQTWVAPETVVERREWAAPGARVQNDINGNSSQNILSNSLAMQVHDSFTETSHGKSVNHNESSSTKHMTTSRDSLVLPVLTTLFVRRAVVDVSCPLCHNHAETLDHLMKECSCVAPLWQIVMNGHTPDQGDDCAAWLLDTLAHGETLFKLRVVAVWWCIWRARNETVWNNKPWQLSSIVHEVYRCVGDWQNLMSGAPALGADVGATGTTIAAGTTGANGTTTGAGTTGANGTTTGAGTAATGTSPCTVAGTSPCGAAC